MSKKIFEFEKQVLSETETDVSSGRKQCKDDFQKISSEIGHTIYYFFKENKKKNDRFETFCCWLKNDGALH